MQKNKKRIENMGMGNYSFSFFFYPDFLPALFFIFMPINHVRVNRTKIESLEIMRCYILTFCSWLFKLHNVLQRGSVLVKP